MTSFQRLVVHQSDWYFQYLPEVGQAVESVTAQFINYVWHDQILENLVLR